MAAAGLVIGLLTGRVLSSDTPGSAPLQVHGHLRPLIRSPAKREAPPAQ